MFIWLQNGNGLVGKQKGKSNSEAWWWSYNYQKWL